MSEPESYDEYISKRIDELDKTPITHSNKYKGAIANSDIRYYQGVNTDVLYNNVIPDYPTPLPTSQKFDESKYLAEIQDYLAGTYKAHYATGNVQTFELIASSGQAEGFTMGSVLKYASRYGKKNGHNRKDLLKIIHYALLQLWVHDKEGYDNHGKETSEKASPR